jgi:hypothetical protein
MVGSELDFSWEKFEDGLGIGQALGGHYLWMVENDIGDVVLT